MRGSLQCQRQKIILVHSRVAVFSIQTQNLKTQAIDQHARAPAHCQGYTWHSELFKVDFMNISVNGLKQIASMYFTVIESKKQHVIYEMFFFHLGLNC